MKHAGPVALDQLEPVLAEVRKISGIRERKRGAFYKGPVGFLHFHEDPAGFFADLKVEGEFVRMRANNPGEIAKLLRAATKAARS